jgi:C-terminal processing protease CtpA/Prc
MMRLVFFLLILCLCSCKQKKSTDPLTAIISLKNALADFQLFGDILQEEHPALTEYISAKRKNFLFDSVYKSIDKEISIRDFYKKLAFLTNEIGCSHSYTSLPPVIVDTLYNRALFFPLPTILLEDDLFINADHDLPHGTKILSINGISTKLILDSLMLYNTVEGNHRETQRHATAGDFGYDYYVHFGVPEKFEVLLKDTTGKIKTVFVDPIPLAELNAKNAEKYYYDPMDVPYSLSINEDWGYAKMRLTSFAIGSGNQQNAFEHFLKNSFDLLSKRKEIQHLIIDLRNNGGGDLFNCFLFHSYLGKNSFKEYESVFSRIKRVSYKDYLDAEIEDADLKSINDRLKNDFTTRTPDGYSIPDSLIDLWVPEQKRFLGNVYIITNHKVASAASQFALMTKYNGNAKLIGIETTGGGNSGNGLKLLKYRLPHSNIGFEFPYAKLVYSFKEPKNGQGLVPDYTIADNYESFISNQDRQLTFIIDSLISKNR